MKEVSEQHPGLLNNCPAGSGTAFAHQTQPCNRKTPKMPLAQGNSLGVTGALGRGMFPKGSEGGAGMRKMKKNSERKRASPAQRGTQRTGGPRATPCSCDCGTGLSHHPLPLSAHVENRWLRPSPSLTQLIPNQPLALGTDSKRPVSATGNSHHSHRL